MLPTVSKGRSSSNSRANPVFPHYLRRIVKWQQMDIEYTFWQMLHLCTSPKVVYQHTKYHKQTKNQWARDDPAFVVICSLLLAVATMAYCAAYDHSAAHAVFVVISVLLFHFIITGAILATCCWLLTNAYLREEAPNSHVVEQRVEWLYAFDVHCNSFFPMFVMLYGNCYANMCSALVFLLQFSCLNVTDVFNDVAVIHYFLSPLLVAHGFIPVLLSNLLFMVAASYYHYLNFLGYDGKLNYMLSIFYFLLRVGGE
ncbi:uncharacterized protein LOC131155638 isoform X1 [Malania oleifera]|uniref:uncharacterized protein LOC131155638 isoform X1 n=1 Tax=Malania oleifera TaxID=397392 RepID=UPI0025ADFBFF|nr:uncharacterized protein LOC131155638 isoform X1 [Malania oleifera]